MPTVYTDTTARLHQAFNHFPCFQDGIRKHQCGCDKNYIVMYIKILRTQESIPTQFSRNHKPRFLKMNHECDAINLAHVYIEREGPYPYHSYPWNSADWELPIWPSLCRPVQVICPTALSKLLPISQMGNSLYEQNCHPPSNSLTNKFTSKMKTWESFNQSWIENKQTDQPIWNFERGLKKASWVTYIAVLFTYEKWRWEN